jgi:hypothetical protein
MKITTKTRILGFKYSLAVVFKGHFAVLIIFPNYGPQMLLVLFFFFKLPVSSQQSIIRVQERRKLNIQRYLRFYVTN